MNFWFVYVINLSEFAANAESTSGLLYDVNLSAFPDNAESTSVLVYVVDWLAFSLLMLNQQLL